jgi:hypothetical protein
LSRVKICPHCNEDACYTEDEWAFEDKHMNLPCDCNSGKLAKDCHPEFFEPDCGTCEARAEWLSQ